MSLWLTVRRHLDRVVASILLVLLAPVIGVCAWLIRRHDGGPALVRLRRVGAQGTEFGMWKLRTMRSDESDGSAGGLPITAGLGDKRITPVGRKLRSCRLDELPQLANVICGEMTLMGPRPETPAFVDLTDERWRRALRARPGIAGPTQVLVHHWESKIVARGGTDAYRRIVLPVTLAVDSWYVAHATPQADILTFLSLLGLRRPLEALRSMVQKNAPIVGDISVESPRRW